MGANQLLIKKPGLYTSIQDLGRVGLMNKGVARSGAMDAHSARLANWLVGNDPDAALLETTFQGLSVEFQCSTIMVITGGNLGVRFNNQPLEMYRPTQVQPGDELVFEKRQTGIRAYLAISGGIENQKIMGSHSEHSMIDLGVKRIEAGAVLKINPAGKIKTGRKVANELKPAYNKHFTARILPGPEFNQFPQQYIDQLTTLPLQVSSDSNRMGYRLQGDFSSGEIPKGILSGGVIPGTIQVPSSGQPIILMNDGPTTGGYARIGNIITPDLNYVSQLGPGDSIRFTWVTFEEADRILNNYDSLMSGLFGAVN